jgi:hypothetical protein
MVFVALPPKISWELEDWCMSQIKAMTKNRQPDQSLPTKFLEAEPADEKIKKEFATWFENNSELKSSLTLKINTPRAGTVREQELLWYQPVVLNHVIQNQKQWEAMVGAYSICFDNEYDEDYVHVAFDMVLVSENVDDGDVVSTKDHLTPLEEQLGESIQAAQTILKEMRYMEKREARMRITSDSIFTKVSWFSVLSVVILLGVTFVQVRYLKSYFRKKKLM